MYRWFVCGVGRWRHMVRSNGSIALSFAHFLCKILATDWHCLDNRFDCCTSFSFSQRLQFHRHGCAHHRCAGRRGRCIQLDFFVGILLTHHFIADWSRVHYVLEHFHGSPTKWPTNASQRFIAVASECIEFGASEWTSWIVWWAQSLPIGFGYWRAHNENRRHQGYAKSWYR